MSDSNTAAIRTTWSIFITAFLALVASRVTGRDVSSDDPLILLAAPVVAGALYVLMKTLSEKVPYLGYLFFLINRSPAYTTPPPAVPALADEPPPAA